MTPQEFTQNPWARKSLFVLANGAILSTILFLVILPINDFFVARDSHIAQQRMLLARMRSMAAQESTVDAITRETAEQLKRGELLKGSSDGIANADLQTRLKTKATQSGAQLRSVQTLPAKTRDGVRYLGAQLDFQGSIQAIQRTIHAIESGYPYHFVTSAQIKPLPAARVAGSAAEPMIEARFEVFVGLESEGQSP